MIKKRNIYLLVFLLFLSTPLRSDYEGSDPDEFWDNIGGFPSIPGRGDERAQTSLNDFGSGVVIGTISNADDASRASAIRRDTGKIIVVGRAASGNNNDFMIVSYNPDGSLDTSFSTNGKHIDSFGTSSGDNTAHAVVLQSDGKLLVAGRTNHVNYSYAILRLTTGGAIDTTFNTTGKARTTFNNAASIARAIVLSTNGQAIVAGYTYASSFYNFSVAKYRTDGALDTTFYTNGRNFLLPASSDSGVFGVAVQTDALAAIVLGGASWNGGNFDFAAIRLTSDGLLDTTFRTNGKITQDFLASGRDEVAYSVGLDANGSIVLGGSAVNAAGNLDFAAVRYLSSGAIDTTFATSGVSAVSITNAAADAAYSMHINTARSLYLGGYTAGTKIFAIMRLGSHGGLDTGFMTTGKTSIAIGATEDVAQSLTVIDEDIIILTGRTKNAGGNFDLAIVRYNTDGTLAQAGSRDKTFNVGSAVDVSGIDTGRGGAVQTDGKVLLIGQYSDSVVASTHPVILRYKKIGGLDTTFHTDGKVTQTFPGPVSGTEFAFAVMVQTDGKLVSAGSGTRFQDSGFMRFETDGRLDTSFHTDGSVPYDSVNGGSVASEYARTGFLTPDGKILGAGGVGGNLTVLRLMQDGALDTSFFTAGKVLYSNTVDSQRAERIVLQGDGRLLIASKTPAGSGGDMTAVRLETNGLLDTSFATDGIAAINASGTSDLGQAIQMQEDGRILVGGTTANPFHLALGRFTTDGIVDTTFNTFGTYVSDLNSSGSESAYGISISPEGKIILTGTNNATDGTRDFMVSRFVTSGILDTTFNTKGFNNAGISGQDEATFHVITPIGKICVTGTPAASGTSGDLGAICWWQ